ncbi:hypothetical protein [Cupriavidus basilensis]|uniref:hypothetical protein n=1 Tax=Cupriavidus basilensis TaxID=68895 RepID=UPI0020C6B5A6|nr:hypothetical protein [Cupriavidus basilensis]
MIALPAQGVAAAVMMVCSAAQSVQSVQSGHSGHSGQVPSVVLPADSPAVESMMLRHAAMKSQAEAALGSHAGAHCHDAADPARQTDGTASLSGMTDQPVHQDHQDHHASHGAGGACSACSACALGAIMPTILPELALASHGHAAPVAALAAYAGFLPVPSDRPPAARC